MNKMFAITALMCASLGLASCLDTAEPESSGSSTYGGTDCFNYVTDMETGESFLSYNPSYKFNFNYTKATCQVEMTNIQLTRGFSGLSFLLPEIDVTQAYQFTKITGTDISPENAAGSYVFTKLDLSYSNRIWDSAYYPIYNLDYIINSRYYITAIPTTQLVFGTTSCVRTSDDEGIPATTWTYTGGEYDIYTLTLSTQAYTGDVRIQAAKFEESMAGINLNFKNIPVSYSHSGFSADLTGVEIKAYDNLDAEIPNITVSDLKISSNITSGTLITFTIDLSNYNTAVADLGIYQVTANLAYYVADDE